MMFQLYFGHYEVNGKFETINIYIHVRSIKNICCVMQVMLVSYAAITNVLKNIKTLLHQLASIFATNILTFSLAPKDLTKNFSALKKCMNKFDCLVYEMFFIHELRPEAPVGEYH